jgi:hypothetical protein
MAAGKPPANRTRTTQPPESRKPRSGSYTAFRLGKCVGPGPDAINYLNAFSKRCAIKSSLKEDRMKPVFLPKYAAEPNVEASTQRRRARAWTDLHTALAQLCAARELAASENPEPAGDIE